MSRGARRAHSRSYVTDEQRSQRAKDQARRVQNVSVEALGHSFEVQDLRRGVQERRIRLACPLVRLKGGQRAWLSHDEGATFLSGNAIASAMRDLTVPLLPHCSVVHTLLTSGVPGTHAQHSLSFHAMEHSV